MLKSKLLALMSLFLTTLLLFNVISCSPKKTIDYNLEDTTISKDFTAFYFSKLSDDYQKYYKKILSELLKLSEEFPMPYLPIDDYSTIYEAIVYDNPAMFYSKIFTQNFDNNKESCIIIPEYKYNRVQIEKYKTDLQTLLKKLDKAKYFTDVNKEKFVHDFIIENFSYDDSFNDDSFSIVGLLKNRKAVCEGIASFTKVALDYLGLESVLVYGFAETNYLDKNRESHAWNIVKIDDFFYHLDVTFDLTISNKLTRYDYFNLGDDDIFLNHELSSLAPVCDDNYNYYYLNEQMTVNSINELNKYLSEEYKNEVNHFVFRLLNTDFSENIFQKVINATLDSYPDNYHSMISNVSCNQHLMIFEVQISAAIESENY
jgi:transglutaminase-like putative cysteine protease